MMNYAEAVAYGKRIGCKYYVYNNYGKLMGGSKTLEGAERMKADFEKEYRDDPWNSDMTFEIRGAE